MTFTILHIVVWFVAAAVAGILVYVVMSISARVLRARARDLAAAREALEEYDRAFDTIMNDPATPPMLLDLLVQFDHGVMHRRAAFFVARCIFRERERWLKSDPNNPISVEMRNLYKHRPDLRDLFAVAISRGFLATMLRWSLPAIALRFLIVDPINDPITPARAVANGGADHPHAPLAQAA